MCCVLMFLMFQEEHYFIKGGPLMNSLEHLIDCYSMHAIELPCKLLYPISELIITALLFVQN